MSNPRGRVLPNARVTVKTLLPNGTTAKSSVSGASVIIRLNLVDTDNPSNVRNKLTQWCKRNNLCAVPLVSNGERDGTFHKVDDRAVRVREESPDCDTYHVIGFKFNEQFEELRNKWFVAAMDFVLDVAIPFGCVGSGSTDTAGARRALSFARSSKPEKLATLAREEMEARPNVQPRYAPTAR